ncbi:ubiquitin specific peptidase 30 (C19 family) [Echinococcus multilocularis]|uniref:Ubiquitin specific peptidase 30 (C19 family) n=1 Tax=Echinococcus multilocularis TaxID=6211 RepID=A0A0S4MHT7_ECHMU|nr:ubiquitin specific peptidase 30 (C19 family) [Echinococcus multilocularis]
MPIGSLARAPFTKSVLREGRIALGFSSGLEDSANVASEAGGCAFFTVLDVVDLDLFFEKTGINCIKVSASAQEESDVQRKGGSMQTLLIDEFYAAERLTGTHCPQFHMEAVQMLKALVNDPPLPVSDRSSILYFAKNRCSCCAGTTEADLFSVDDYVAGFIAGGVLSQHTVLT